MARKAIGGSIGLALGSTRPARSYPNPRPSRLTCLLVFFPSCALPPAAPSGWGPRRGGVSGESWPRPPSASGRSYPCIGRSLLRPVLTGSKSSCPPPYTQGGSSHPLDLSTPPRTLDPSPCTCCTSRRSGATPNTPRLPRTFLLPPGRPRYPASPPPRRGVVQLPPARASRSRVSSLSGGSALLVLCSRRGVWGISALLVGAADVQIAGAAFCCIIGTTGHPRRSRHGCIPYSMAPGLWHVSLHRVACMHIVDRSTSIIYE